MQSKYLNFRLSLANYNNLGTFFDVNAKNDVGSDVENGMSRGEI